MQCPKCSYHNKGKGKCQVCDFQMTAEVIKKPYRIPKRTKDRVLDEKEYAIKSKEFLLINSQCAVFPELKAIEVHHIKGRSGKMLLNEKYWLPVSREGHNKIGSNPEWAFKNKYSISRLTK